jgi:hypothetical protein
VDALNVAALSREKKVEETILRGIRLLPADVGAQLKSMLSPQSLAIMVASLVGLAIAQAFGIGEFIDALVLLAGIGFCGWGVVDGGRDLFHSVRTALNARTERDLDEAGRYFASAVTKIGVSAVMAFLLKKPLRSFRDLKGFEFRNVRPGLENIGPAPAPGTVPAIEFKPLSNALGITTAYGNIVIDSGLDEAESRITLDHELVHRFLSPKFGPFLRLRASVRINGYVRSAMLKYLEEAMAEGYAQVRAHGLQGVITGVRWPIVGGYLSIDEMAVMRGTILGTIVVDGRLMHVSIVQGSPDSTNTPQPVH